MQIELIKWMVSPPAHFPCFACKDRESEYHVTIRLSDAGTLRACLCSKCSKMTELELIAIFYK